MVRPLLVAALVSAIPAAAVGQSAGVLHIKAVLVDSAGNPRPVPRHALLVSENPASAAPRLIVTGADGTAEVKLRPGSYTVESDKPVTFEGKAYQWTLSVTVAAGQDTMLELTAANAEITATTGTSLEADPAFLLPKWQDGVVAIWSPTTRATGFFVSAAGVLVTTERVVGRATSVEIQLDPATKVAANVITTDPERDVAVVRINPEAMPPAVPSLPLPCADSAKSPVTDGQELLTISAPIHEPKGITTGTVLRAGSSGIVSDFLLPRGGVGGPVFTPEGQVVGIASLADVTDRNADVRVVPGEAVCAVVAAANERLTSVAPASAAHLPVEPRRPFPMDALKAAVEGRAGNLNPYLMSSSTFDIAFITPIHTYGAQYTADQMRRRRTTSKDTHAPPPEPPPARPLLEFGNWSEYVWEFPPVLLVRVTPKLVEGFWTMVARGAARTQGVAIPAIKRPSSGFSSLRAFCGGKEVTPIHPFRIEQQMPDDSTIYEGLYVFDPDALGPECGSVKLALYSEKEPDNKGDTRIVDPKIVQQMWNDFDSYRKR